MPFSQKLRQNFKTDNKENVSILHKKVFFWISFQKTVTEISSWVVHLGDPFSKIRTAQRTNQNYPFQPVTNFTYPTQLLEVTSLYPAVSIVPNYAIVFRIKVEVTVKHFCTIQLLPLHLYPCLMIPQSCQKSLKRKTSATTKQIK